MSTRNGPDLHDKAHLVESINFITRGGIADYAMFLDQVLGRVLFHINDPEIDMAIENAKATCKVRRDARYAQGTMALQMLQELVENGAWIDRARKVLGVDE